MRQTALVCVIFLGTIVVSTFSAAEIVYLTNGDVVHGTLVAANNDEVTLKTAFGQLLIPKKEIARIDYQTTESKPEPGAKDPEKKPEKNKEKAAAPPPPPPPPRPPGGRGSISLEIGGRSFWYAFDSPAEAPADTSIRFRLYVGDARACTFVDEKPDTVDGPTFYNSFTFSPTDARLLETLEGYECSVEKAEDGVVQLKVGLPPEASTGRQVLRMLYEVNEGDRSAPRWMEVVSRSFSIDVAPGREAVALLEQNADALEYTGFFKKKMKNLELFRLDVRKTGWKD
jgi:hypothetical protein